MTELYVINDSALEKANRFLRVVEDLILDKSYRNRLMGKFTTGFGWKANLMALNSKSLIDNELSDKIDQIHDFYNNLCIGRRIHVDTWNSNILRQNEILTLLM